MTEPVMVGGAPVPASNKRAFTMLGVAAVVAVLILVLPKLLFAGGDEEAVDEAEVPASVLPPSGALEGALPGGGGAEQALADPARTFEVFSTKNPFTPLIDMTPVAIPVPGASAIVVPTTGAPAPVLGAPAPAPVSGEPAPAPAPVFGAPAPAPVFGAPAPAPVPGAPAPAPAFGAPTPAAEPRSGQRVALLEVFVDAEGVTVASIRVNDTVYEVAEGASFATSYKVVTLSVADGCGQLLYGDDRFRLCEGEELLK
jgi:hypothetical protein